MVIFGKFMSVLGLGILELWAAIPAGVAMGLHPFLTGCASAAGSIIALILVVLLGDKIRNWIIQRKGGKKVTEDSSRIYRVWNKYGVIGLGLLSPLLTGAPLGAALGIAFGVPPKSLILWMAIGIIVWTVILTAISILGFAGFHALRG